jgi:hypothetical protein
MEPWIFKTWIEVGLYGHGLMGALATAILNNTPVSRNRSLLRAGVPLNGVCNWLLHGETTNYKKLDHRDQT